jgi:15-cis-phytoene synthase
MLRFGRRRMVTRIDRDARLARVALRRGSKSFALAARLLPKQARDDVAIVYAFCRRADDAIDEAATSRDAEVALQRLREDVDAIRRSGPLRDGSLEPIRSVVHRRGIPGRYLLELVEGFAMDVRNERYSDQAALERYAFRVAGTVGLMMCHVLGVRRDAALRHAVDLGVAMQLTNVCRDVLEDWERGRLYLPLDALHAEGLGDLDPRRGAFPDEATSGVARVIAALLARAEVLYRSGDVGLDDLPMQAALAVDTARSVYAAIGEELARRGFDVHAGRATVPLRRKLALALRAAARAVPRARRVRHLPRPRPPEVELASAAVGG